MENKGSMQKAKNSSPLRDIRVLELGTGVAAPFACQLLQMLGATVVKLERAERDPAREYPVDDRETEPPSPLFLYLNCGKRNVEWDAKRLAAGLEWADVVVDSRVQSEVEPSILDAVAARNKRYITITAWGFEASEPGEIDDELIVQARAGVMTVTGDVDAAPLRFPGFQSQYLAGAFAAAGATASLLAGDQGALHVDVPWVFAMTAGTEGSYQLYLHLGIIRPPPGPNPPGLFPSGAFKCADGFVVPGTVRHHDWEVQCLLYGRPDLLTDERFATPAARAENYRALWAEIQPWYDENTRAHILSQALGVGWACGVVLDSLDVLTDPHLNDRGFLAAAARGERSWKVPARLARGLEWDGSRGISEFGADSVWFDEMAAAQ